MVKQNLHAIHKLIRRAREVPVDKQPEKIAIEQFPTRLNENTESDDIHDWSKESNVDDSTFSPVKVTVKKSSNVSNTFSRDADLSGSKTDIRLQIEENFRDPFCPRTIPYELYLTRNKPVIDIVNQEETIIEYAIKITYFK